MLCTYSNVEYTDMVLNTLYDFCNGNVLFAETVQQYVRRFPNRRMLDRRVIAMIFNRLRETGSFSIH